LTQREAAEVVSLSEREILRITKRIEAEGDTGIQHGSRSKASNRRLPQKLVGKVVRSYREKDQGLGKRKKVATSLRQEENHISRQ